MATKENLLKALLTPRKHGTVNEEAHANTLLNDALLNYEKVKNTNYPIEFRVKKFLEARQQILDILSYDHR